MKSPKVMLFLIILSLVVASGWLPSTNASAAPVTDGWSVDPTVTSGTYNQPVKGESVDISKLPAARALSAADKAALQKLVMPQNLPVDAAAFAQLKADAAKNPAPSSAQVQKFSVKNSPQAKPGSSVVTPKTTTGLLSGYAPEVIDNFAGPSMNGYYPADATIAVGPTSMIACVNASVVGYDKTGLVLYNTPMTTWWSSTLRSGYSLIFNPVCKYDAQGGRFIIVAALENASPFVSKYLVSVSQTSDVVTGWYNYAFDASVDGSTATSYFAAFPDVGFDNNAVYITSNQYSISSQAFQYSKIRVFSKTELYTNTLNNSHVTDFVNFTNISTGTKAFAVRAAASLDSSNYEYFADSQPTGGSQLALFRITSANPWVTPVFSKASVPTVTTAYSTPPNAIQIDTTYVRVPTGDSRLLNLVLKNGSLWTAHTISGSSGSTNVAAIRWYQLDPVGAGETQEGTFLDGDDYSYYYPVVVADSLGDMGIAYNWSGPGDYINIAFTGRLATDTAGQMEYPRYYVDNGSRVNTSGRWGAYGGAALDPSSSRMWFIHQTPGASTVSWGTDIFSSEFAVAQPFNKTIPADGASNASVASIIAWSASTGADNYQFCYDTTNDNACNWLTATTTTSLSATLNLLPSTTYYWQVRAVRGSNYTYADGSATAFRRFTTGVLPPAFGKISPVSASTNMIVAPTLSWNSSAGADSYSLCLTTVVGGCVAYTPYWINVGNVTTYPASGLLSSTTYYWQIRANNSVGRTYADTNTPWTFTTGALAGAFFKTSPINGVINQPLSMTLAWNVSAGAANYQYCYDTDSTKCTSSGSGSWTTTAATSTVISGLAQNTTYYWHVKVVNPIGTTWSNADTSWSFTTGTAPAPFDKTSPSSPANGSTHQALAQTLSWNASFGATGYEYCYAVDPNICDSSNGVWTGNGTSTNVLVTFLEGTKYNWQVRATSPIGSTYANTGSNWNFTTGSTPAAFTKSLPGNTAIGQASDVTLSWNASNSNVLDGSLSYQYCLYTTNSNDCNVSTGNWLSTTTPTTEALTDLGGSTTYHWQVRAQNSIGYRYADTNTTWTFATGLFPGIFSKTSPTNALNYVPVRPTLTWGSSATATSYEYCLSITSTDCAKGSNIANWHTNGSSTSYAISSNLVEGQTYYWQVRAVNGVGKTYADGSTSIYSFTVGHLPLSFTKSSPINNVINQLLLPTLNWTASSSFNVGDGTLTYQYCLNTANTCSSSSAGWTNVPALSGNSFTLTSQLAQLTDYYWQVRATNNIGTVYADSLDTATAHFTTGQTPAAFNKSLPATSATGQTSSVNLSWAASNVSTYDYCVSTTTCTPASTWTSVVTNSATVNNLGTPGVVTNYFWQVRATNAIGFTYANAADVTPVWTFQVGALPGAFSMTSPADAATGQLTSPTLTWAASSGVTTYSYCTSLNIGDCDKTGAGAWTSNASATSVGLSGLTQTTTYYWNVRATNTFGTTYAATTARSFTTGLTPLDFQKSAPVDGDTGDILTPTLSWTASTNATTYDYCVSLSSSSCTTSWVSAGANTSVTLAALASSTQYYWQVRAVGASLVYADSGSATTGYYTFTTGSFGPPAAFTKTAPPATAATNVSLSVTLNWAASAGASSYDICLTTAPNCNTGPWYTLGNVTSYTAGVLDTNKKYQWQLRATNSSGTTYADGGTALAPGSWNFTTINTTGYPGTFKKTTPANNATGIATNTTLVWATSAGSTSFQYCISTTVQGCTNTTGIWTTATSPATPAGLQASTAYYWQVRALNATGTTYADDVPFDFSFTTAGPAGAFNKSTPASGTSGVSTLPTLTWTASSGVTTYDYCVSTSSSSCAGTAPLGTWTTAGTNTSVTLTTNLAGLTTYYWQVRANGSPAAYADGGSATTGYFSFTTTTLPFIKTHPTNNATNVCDDPVAANCAGPNPGTRLVNLTWSADAGATQYFYCIATTLAACSTGGSGTWISVGTALTVQLPALPKNTQEYWQVKALDGSGTSYADGGPTVVYTFKTKG